MFGIPDAYHIGKVADVRWGRVLSEWEMSRAKKRKFSGIVKELKVEYVVNSSEIPACVTEELNVSAVQFLSVRVEKISAASFVCEILQKLIKTLCVIRVYDDSNEAFSFALKRLSKTDLENIVVQEGFISGPFRSGSGCVESQLVEKYCSWDTVVNRTNLYSWYVELMVKAYIMSHRGEWSRMEELLSSKVWFNTDDVLVLFAVLRELSQLTKERCCVVRIGDTVRVNGELRRVFGVLEGYI